MASKIPLLKLPLVGTKPPIIKYDDAEHRYWIDKIEVPSVSAILAGVSPKEALGWWGMRVGIAAVLWLMKESKLTWPTFVQHDVQEIIDPNRYGVEKSPRVYNKKKGVYRTEVEHQAIIAKRTVNHIRDDGAERGTAVHAAAEYIGTHEQFPDISEYPELYHGYIRALAKFWFEQEPKIHRQEVITASRTNGYAGRFDLDCDVKAHADRRTLVDFKTSKDIYDSHHEQNALYRLAESELAGEDVFEHTAIVLLKPDGDYVMRSGDHVSERTARLSAELWHSREHDEKG